MEWLDAHSRLEEKRKAAVRRQQREQLRKKKDAQVREKELQKLAIRCREMEQEERLSVKMEAFYLAEEEQKKMEIQRLNDFLLFEQISRTRKRTVTLGLSVSTSGAIGLQRLRLLETRIAEKELSLKKSHDARVRLDALPAKRNKLTQLMRSYFASNVKKKVEKAVYYQHSDRLVPLFDLPTEASKNGTVNLLNHESENGFTPVLVMIFKRKLSRLRQLLEMGASPNTETKTGMTPLLAVVMTDNIVALSILREFKVDLNYETNNHVNAVLLAVDKGRAEILKQLMEYGANVDGVNGTGRSTLIQATISGNTHICQILIAYGANKELRDNEGKTAVDWAIQLQFTALVSLLNSSISSVNLLAQLKAEDEEADGEILSSISTNRIIRRQRMAEMDRALRCANIEKIQELLSTEGTQLSPNYEDASGNSPLLVVCTVGTYADVVYCLKKNCIPTHQNRDGIHPVLIACKRGDISVIQLLVNCGCSLLTRDFSGHDAFYYLNRCNHPDLAISFTRKCRSRYCEIDSALTLGNIVLPVSFLKSEYSISLVEVDISLGLEVVTHESCRIFNETDNVRPVHDTNDESDNDPVIRRWGIQQKTLKQDRRRLQLYEKERERILAARIRGRRNGLIAPLPLDQGGRLKFPICDSCKKIRARKRCPSCDQVLCDKCHSHLHELAYRRHHQYEELEPKPYVAHELKEVAQRNQENSLAYTVKKSASCVLEMRSLLLGDDDLSLRISSPNSIDLEIEKYERRKRITKEKKISQMQINVPVAAAKHAAQADEGTIFTQPAELEIATLYTSQKKYEKAEQLLQQVEKLITDTLGVLHPTMLKVAIGRGRILQDTDQHEQCASTVHDALSLFEGILPLDHKDMLMGTSIVLQNLNIMERYHEAVQVCRHIQSIRSQAFSPGHKCLKDIQEQLDLFISKREMVNMSTKDLVTLKKIAEEKKRMEQLANESQKHLENFRKLLMNNPEGLATFLTFAKQEFVEDLVMFWILIEKFKQDDVVNKALRLNAVNIYLNYIKSRRIKVITAAQRKKIKKIITSPGKKIPRSLFDDIQAQIFELVYKGVYLRYLNQTK